MAKERVRKKKNERGSMKPTLNNLYKAIDEVLQNITSDLYESVDRGLDKAARYMEQRLVEETPEGETGKTRGSWKINFKYKNVRYINNSSTRPGNPDNDGEGSEVPIVNVLEFGSKGKPFFRRTVQAEHQHVIDIIKGEIENGKTK